MEVFCSIIVGTADFCRFGKNPSVKSVKSVETRGSDIEVNRKSCITIFYPESW
jgi:hypothetical protein